MGLVRFCIGLRNQCITKNEIQSLCREFMNKGTTLLIFLSLNNQPVSSRNAQAQVFDAHFFIEINVREEVIQKGWRFASTVFSPSVKLFGR